MTAPAGLPSVVFVCGRNAVRSPMGEALWRKRFGDKAQAVSCGVEPAAFPDGYMIAVMAETGADLSRFECRDLNDVSPGPGSLVVCLAEEACDEARRLAERTGARAEDWVLPDPTEAPGGRDAKLDAYRAVRDRLAERIEIFASGR